MSGIWYSAEKGSDGLWKWSGRLTGTVDFLLWDVNEPDNPNEKCAGTFFGSNDANNAKGYSAGKTDDAPCSTKIPFVCEKNL